MKKIILFCLLFAFGTAGYGQDTTYIRTIMETMFPSDSLYIGTACHAHYLGTPTEEIIDNEFNYITPANDFKQSYIHPDLNTWRWANSDKWVNHCRENNQLIRLHAPISPQSSPWVKDDSRTAGELEQMLGEFVTGLCERYNDSSHIIWLDVVNETLNSDGTWFGPKPGTDSWENPWPLIGYDESIDLRPPLYIKQSFEFAQQFGSNFKNIINQHSDTEVSWEKLKELVFYLRGHDLRVDGIGWQAHVDLGWEKIPGNMERLGNFIDWCHQNDLEFHITEFNVWLRTGDELKYDQQADTFYEIVKLAASKYKTGIVGINFWHIRGAETQNPERDGGLWTKEYVPKKGYYDVKRALIEIATEAGPEIRSVPDRSGITGVEYSYQPDLHGVIGTPNFDLATSPSAPWLSIDNQGMLSGTPTETDTLTIQITVTDDSGSSIQEYTFIVYAEPLEITSTPVENATAEFPYSYPLTNTGGGSWTFSATPGAEWLAIDENNVLTGTPDTSGTFLISLFLSRNDITLMQEFTLGVEKRPAITSAPKTEASEGVEYKYFVGYEGSGTFQLVTEPPADWLSIDQNGLLTGIPDQPDTIHITVTLINELTSVSQEFDLYIAEALTITSDPLADARVGVLYEYQVEHTGIGEFSLTTNSEAPWITIGQTGLVSGTPAEKDTIQISVKLKNSFMVTNQVYTLTVGAPVNTAKFISENLQFNPNPATDRVIISGTQPGQEILLIDFTGRLLLKEYASSNETIFHLKHIQKGIYLLKTACKSGVLIVK